VKKKESAANVLYETAFAEYGSALEMLAACKQAIKVREVLGFFEHARDEYIHTKKFLSILKKQGGNLSNIVARKYKFVHIGALKKGYVSEKGYLIETKKMKDFVAYIYTNELIAEDEFSKILKYFEDDKESTDTIHSIMKDELRHHGMARKYFLKYYPFIQPYQLMIYKYREYLHNKGRKFYFKNFQILEKLFTPIYFFVSYLVSLPLRLLNQKEFSRINKNLMDISSKSLL